MIKYAALITTLFLVGCGSVPHVEEELKFEDSNAGTVTETVPPAAMMAPPPPVSYPAPVGTFAPAAAIELTEHTTAHAAKEIAEARTTVAKIASKLPKKAANVLTEAAGSVMSVAEAATTSSNVKITEYDEKGNVIKVADEHRDSFMDFLNKILDSMTKLIGLGTGALGLYVGFQKLRNPTVKPETA